MLDERHRSWLIAVGALALVGLLGAATWLAVSWPDAAGVTEPPKKAKVFHRTLIEDLRVTRHGVMGVDLIRCGVCRLEKRKKGVLTFGGMNTLVLEGLEVVLPPEEGGRDGGANPPGEPQRLAADGSPYRCGDGQDARAVVRRLGISDDFLAKRGVPFRFSAVRIAGLSVGRLAGSNRVERIFSARSGVSRRDGLALSECRLCQTGADGGEGERELGAARLVLDGHALRLVWDGGAIDVR